MACPGSGGPLDERKAASSPQGVVPVAAYSSKDGDHNRDHDHTQIPPTPPICLSGQALPQPSARGYSNERAANGINIYAGGMAAAGVISTATHHGHPPTRGASIRCKSPFSPSADAAGVVNKEGGEGGRPAATKTAENELATTLADDRSSNNDNNVVYDDGGGKSAFCPNLDDLSALLPEEIRLSQSTLCKVTTEQERSVELGSRSSARPEDVGGDSPIFEVHLRVLLRDFPTTSTAHFERGLSAALKRGIADVVDTRENKLPPSAKGSLSSKVLLYVVLLAVVVFLLPLGSICVLCGGVALVWCHSRAKDKTDGSGGAVARGCHLLVANEEENEYTGGAGQGGDEDGQGEDEEQGQACKHDAWGGSGSGGGDSNDGCGDHDDDVGSGSASAAVDREIPATGFAAEQEDAGFDFFLNGWGFFCPSRRACCCCLCGNKRAPLLASSLSPPPPSPCADSRRPALLSIKPSKELRVVRLIQLLKFADPRANAYLNEPSGQELLSDLELLHPSLPPTRGSPRGLDGPFR